jgi:transcription termination factor Rho
MNLAELKHKSIQELSVLATELKIDGVGPMRRQELIFSILRAQGDRREIRADGVLEVLPDGFGFLRAGESNYLPGPDDIYVSPSQIRRFNLHTGDTVQGVVRPPKESERYFALLKVEAVNSRQPDEQRGKIPFDELQPIYPNQKLALELTPDRTTARAVDLLCPIGKGQRCLVAAPPRSGKSTLLRDVARALAKNHADVALLVLLVDARPEEVTDMRRTVEAGEVVSSTFEEPPSRHVQVAEIVLEKAKRMVENGRDVAVLLDSLTALTRAYNAVSPPSGKELVPGLDVTAFQKPKRFFGAARKVEGGGSLTVIATAMRDTGYHTDEIILEQFAGSANCEIWFERTLVEQRLFPAIDVHRSSTLRDELLLSEKEQIASGKLRRELSKVSREEAVELLNKHLALHSSNHDLLAAASK